MLEESRIEEFEEEEISHFTADVGQLALHDGWIEGKTLRRECRAFNQISHARKMSDLMLSLPGSQITY